jgi:hypothetical protein
MLYVTELQPCQVITAKSQSLWPCKHARITDTAQLMTIICLNLRGSLN